MKSIQKRRENSPALSVVREVCVRLLLLLFVSALCFCFFFVKTPPQGNWSENDDEYIRVKK